MSKSFATLLIMLDIAHYAIFLTVEQNYFL